MIIVALVAMAAARPDKLYEARDSSSAEHAHIITDDRVNPSASGEFRYAIETSNGIRVSESGAGTGPDGAVETSGSVAFSHPNGESFELTFVADAAGYKAESSALPIAPAFPHEIPQFVLDQIAFAADEDARGINHDVSSSGESARYYSN